MPFLGNTPAQGFANAVTKDDFTPDGSTTAFTMSKVAGTSNDVEVYVGNVRQEPTSAYSVSGTTLTMTEAPASNTNFYVVHIQGTIESGTVPGDGSVTGAKIVSGTITSANIAAGVIGGKFKGENGTVGNDLGDIFRVHEKVLNTNVTISGTENALCAGPLEVATNITLEVATGGTLVIT